MKRLSENEPFLINGKPYGLTMLDFWQFQFSNIFDLQEHIAEFLVAKALGLNEPHNRDGWTLWDIEYQGIRIEVKETGYYHSWRKDGKTSTVRTFGITKAYSADGTHTKARQNDIYVFCLNTGENEDDSNPLILEHWKFYIIPTSEINEKCKDNKSISLSVVEKMASEVPFTEIKGKIDELIQKIK